MKPKLTPKNIQKALELSWSEETCWPGCFDRENLSAGHCRVTSAVVYTLLGGEILFAKMRAKPLYTHFWNKLPNGKEYDFTKNQFKKNTAIPKGGKVSFKKVMAAKPMKKAYLILLKRIKKYFKL